MNSITSSAARTYSHLLGVLLATTLIALAVMTGTAQAGGEVQFEGNLAGGTWTTDSAVGNLFEESVEQGTNSDNVCVGPVQHSASGYTFPYGWTCHGFRVIWEFPTISALAGVYNQGGKTFKFNGLAFYH